MLAEWSVECSAEDPVLVVPWKDPDGTAAFVDLRANPYDFDAIPEAEQYPPLMQALRALNATRSPVFTAKCDAWPLADDELEHLQLNLDIDSATAGSRRICQLHRSGLHASARCSHRFPSTSSCCAGSPASPLRSTVPPQRSIAFCGLRCSTWMARSRATHSACTSRRSAPTRKLLSRSGPPRSTRVVALVRGKDFTPVAGF